MISQKVRAKDLPHHRIGGTMPLIPIEGLSATGARVLTLAFGYE